MYSPTTIKLGDNCIRNFYLGRYIVGYTVGNLVLRRGSSGAVKHDFQMYIRQYTYPNRIFEYGYPNYNAIQQFCLKVEPCKPHRPACHPTKCDIINDFKLNTLWQIFHVIQSDVALQKQVH